MREELMARLEKFKNSYPVEGALQGRVIEPPVAFIGEEIRDLAVSALLQGENILLCGGKATGKNILADNLAWLFGRPVYNVSFHVNTDSSTLIGTDTFVGGEVRLRNGPIAQAARHGGFCILDEINMAKNEAVAVMHSVLDYRRLIDVPGYECIPMHPATRFIATMNYGYAGTRELNEALASRFVVIDMPAITTEDLIKLLCREYPDLRPDYAEQFAGLFREIQKKCDSGELSTKPLDLRGLVAAVRLMKTGLEGNRALELGLVNKSFDDFEKQLVSDIIRTRLPDSITYEDVFA